MKKMLATLAAATLLMTGCGGDNSANQSKVEEIHVAAAASLTDAMKEIAADYEKENPNVKVVFNFGSSGALQQAIENGGETDLFFFRRAKTNGRS